MSKLKGWVALEGVILNAYHGVYDKERKSGGQFIVDLSVRGDVGPAANSDNIQEAINYEILARIVEEEMQIQSSLLEHVAYRILRKTLDSLEQVDQAKIKIVKKNPPIELNCEGTSVSLRLRRKDLN